MWSTYQAGKKHLVYQRIFTNKNIMWLTKKSQIEGRNSLLIQIWRSYCRHLTGTLFRFSPNTCLEEGQSNMNATIVERAFQENQTSRANHKMDSKETSSTKDIRLLPGKKRNTVQNFRGSCVGSYQQQVMSALYKSPQHPYRF